MKRARSSFITGKPFVLLGLSKAELRQLQVGHPLRIEAETVSGSADVLLAAARSDAEMAAQLARGEQSLPEAVGHD
jgi:hypothetical protein